MKNFGQRAVTGLSFAFIMSAAILYSQWTFLAVFFLISTLGIYEFYKLTTSDKVQPQSISGVIVAQIMFLVLAWILLMQKDYQWIFVAFPLTAVIFILELYRKKENPFLNLAVTLAGMIYFTIPMLLIVKIALGFMPDDELNYHGQIIMGCIFLLWASDTGAYMIGSTFGKHKLFERISPNKSWEGFFGGMLTSLLAAWVISIWFEDLEMIQWMIISVIIVTMGTLGDLVESMLKRSLNVKDSGTIFPGHGGILDRFDGLLISIPFVFFYLMMIGKFG